MESEWCECRKRRTNIYNKYINSRTNCDLRNDVQLIGCYRKPGNEQCDHDDGKCNTGNAHSRQQFAGVCRINHQLNIQYGNRRNVCLDRPFDIYISAGRSNAADINSNHVGHLQLNGNGEWLYQRNSNNGGNCEWNSGSTHSRQQHAGLYRIHDQFNSIHNCGSYLRLDGSFGFFIGARRPYTPGCNRSHGRHLQCNGNGEWLYKPCCNNNRGDQYNAGNTNRNQQHTRL